MNTPLRDVAQREYKDDFPRVVMLDRDHRVVDLCHEIVLEQRSHDALGEDRWDRVADGEPNKNGMVLVPYRTWLVVKRILARQADNAAYEQIEDLASFIMAEVPGEPSQDEGAVDTAIRLLRQVYRSKAAQKGEHA